MKAEFWLERWQRNEIGFHQEEINAHLQDYWGSLQLPAGAEVFVPLCGKSRDMLWLRAQGYRVLGVELSPLAVEDFFLENELKPQVRSHGAFDSWSCDGVTLLCGDFFELEPADLKGIAAVYDRASLVALPPEMRTEYARHLHKVLPARVPMLLVTMDYAQAEMDGPPFSVSAAEVQRLYAGHYDIARLYTHDVLSENARFRERGLTRLDEVVFHLQP
ncbi:MAG: thiopurine S-methyltransferase [Pseudomonadota bacterium]